MLIKDKYVLYNKNSVISVAELKELKKYFNVVYNYSKKVDITLHDNKVFLYNGLELDCSHWMNNSNVSKGEILVTILETLENEELLSRCKL